MVSMRTITNIIRDPLLAMMQVWLHQIGAMQIEYIFTYVYLLTMYTYSIIIYIEL